MTDSLIESKDADSYGSLRVCPIGRLLFVVEGIRKSANTASGLNEIREGRTDFHSIQASGGLLVAGVTSQDVCDQMFQPEDDYESCSISEKVFGRGLSPDVTTDLLALASFDRKFDAETTRQYEEASDA